MCFNDTSTACDISVDDERNAVLVLVSRFVSVELVVCRPFAFLCGVVQVPFDNYTDIDDCKAGEYASNDE